MSSYTRNLRNKAEEILYTGSAAKPTKSFYPTKVLNAVSDVVSDMGASGATGGAGTPTASPTGTSGVLYTDGAAALPTDSYGYAEWLRNNSYQNATDAANKARQEALLNKQNALVGADTAYKQGLATYGANAESLASKGLSNSGYGEYLTGKNYATARAEKAAANATYQGAMNDILYQENSAKQEADQLYAKTMIELKEKDKADAQTAYDALMNSAISGIDLGTLQADARWGSLSPDQVAAITSMVNQKALETRINNGETLDSIMASEEWGGLSTSAQGNLQNAYNVKVRGERYMNAERDAKAGKYTADTITTIDGWNEFTQAERDALTDLVDEAAKSTSDTHFDNKSEIIADIDAGNYETYTDEYIDGLVNRSRVSPDDVAAIKDKRADAAFQSIINRITGEGGFEALSEVGGVNELVKVLNEMQEKKYLSHDEVMQLYDYAIEVRDSPYKNVYVSESAGEFTIKFSDGSTATVDSTRVSDQAQRVLQDNIPNAKGKRVYQYDGAYYVKRNNKWYNINTTAVKNAMASEEKVHVVAPRRNK